MSDMRETDTSTEAVEAMACHLSLHWNGAAAEMLRTLLRERNEARRERDAAYEECAKRLEDGARVETSIRRAELLMSAANEIRLLAIRAAAKARQEGC